MRLTPSGGNRMLRLAILFIAALMTTLAAVWADEPKPILKLDGTLTTESDKEPGVLSTILQLTSGQIEGGASLSDGTC